MYIRQATIDDVDSLTELDFAAFKDDSQLDYLCPKRREYPEDYAQAMRERLISFFEDPKTYLIMLASSETSKDHAAAKPVAYALWRLQDMTNDSIKPGENMHFLFLPISFREWKVVDE
jgi:hypothetical protein